MPAVDCSTPKALNDELNLHDSSRDILAKISGIFVAIRRLSADPTNSHTVGQLAGTGQYIADDWANTLDCYVEEQRQADVQP